MREQGTMSIFLCFYGRGYQPKVRGPLVVHEDVGGPLPFHLM